MLFTEDSHGINSEAAAQVSIKHEGQRNAKAQLIVQVAIACLVSVIASFVYFRGERVLGNDQYFYLEQAKAFTTALPMALGELWPLGYPLAGGLLARTGIHPYYSMILINISCLVGIVALLAFLAEDILRQRRLRAIGIIFLATLPFFARATGLVMSEYLFALSVLLFTFSLSSQRGPIRFATLAISIPLAISARYVGVFLWPALVSWCLLEVLLNGEQKKSINRYVLYGISGIVVSGALLYTNLLAHGSFFPGGRAPSHFSVFYAADMGLGFLSSYSTSVISSLRDFSALRLTVGLVLLFAVLWLAWRSIVYPISRSSRPIGVVLLWYSTALIAMRSVAVFDDLWNSRFSAPVLPLVAIMVIEQIEASRLPTKYISRGMFVLIAVSIFQSSAGINHGAFRLPEVHKALDILPKDALRESLVAINSPAHNHIAAYMARPMAIVDDEADLQNGIYEHIIIFRASEDSDANPQLKAQALAKVVIPNTCSTTEEFRTSYKIAKKLTSMTLLSKC